MSNFFDLFKMSDDDDLFEDNESHKDNDKNLESADTGIRESVPYLTIAAIMIWIALIKCYPISIWSIIISSIQIGSAINIMFILLSFINNRKVRPNKLLVPILTCMIGIGLFWARYYFITEGIDIIHFNS